jgi:hypothetical protein
VARKISSPVLGALPWARYLKPSELAAPLRWLTARSGRAAPAAPLTPAANTAADRATAERLTTRRIRKESMVTIGLAS